MEQLLNGKNLINADDVSFSVEDAFNGVEAIGLYFSAHWCGPCRKFTPALTEYYNQINATEKRFEIVFMSSDRDQSQFTEYRKSMPWLTLDIYEDGNADLKTKLSGKYGVRGIPALIILSPDGSLITDQGRTGVMSSPEAFPWHPKSFWEIIDGDLKNNAGETFSTDSLKTKQAVAIYFSAHWCGPCQNFTPKLIQTYNALKESGTDFEVVFASSDNSASEYDEYFGKMPWLSIPFKDQRKEELSTRFKVEGIPTLVIINPQTGEVIQGEGVGRVTGDPTGSEFPWYPKACYNIDEAPGNVLNEKPVFVLFNGEIEPEFIETFQAIAQSRVDLWNSAGEEQPLYFVYATKTNQMYARLAQFMNLDQTVPLFVLLNLGEQKKSVLPNASYTADAAEAFIEAYLAGALEFVHYKA